MRYQKHIYHLVSLLTGTIFSMIASFLVRVFLARNSSVEAFGNYSSILTIITTFAPLCGFGVAQWWLKISGQYGITGFPYIRKSVKFIICTTAIVFIFLTLWFLLSLTANLLIMSLLLIFILFNNVVSELVVSTLQLQSKYFALSVWQFLQASMVLIIAILFLFIVKKDFSEVDIGILYFINSIIFSFIGFFIIKQYFSRQYSLYLIEQNFCENLEKYPITTLIKEVVPFGIAGLFYLIYYQLGIVFVRYFEGAEAASYYSIAFSFLSVAIAVPGVIYQKFLLPKLHHWAYHDRKIFLQSYKYGNYLMIVLGCICGLGLWLLAPHFITWFFGDRYLSAIPLVQLMAINIPIVYLASSAGSLLVTQDHMKVKVIYMGISAVISLILNPILVFEFGVYGAVYTNIISNFCILIFYFRAVRYRVINIYDK